MRKAGASKSDPHTAFRGSWAFIEVIKNVHRFMRGMAECQLNGFTHVPDSLAVMVMKAKVCMERLQNGSVPKLANFDV